MKISYLVLVLAALAATPSARAAGILVTEDSAKTIDDVVISKGGTLSVDGRKAAVITAGAGFRAATLGVHAYVAELLVDNKDKFCAGSRGLENLKDLNTIVMKANVTSMFATKAKFIKAFNEGFKNNGFAANDADVAQFMAAVTAGSDPSVGTAMIFAGEKVDGKEIVTLQDSAGKVTKLEAKAAGFVAKVFSLWLGKTDDDGLKDLIGKLKNCQI